jgi:hypothetical protein
MTPYSLLTDVAYTQQVHVWIASQAAQLFATQFDAQDLQQNLGNIGNPSDAPEVGTPSYDFGCGPNDPKSWDGTTVLEGAWEEDTVGVWNRHFVQGPDNLESGLKRDDWSNVAAATLLLPLDGGLIPVDDGRYDQVVKSDQYFYSALCVRMGETIPCR